MQQRAKILSHSFQRKLRRQKLSNAVRKIEEKKEVEMKLCDAYHKKSEEGMAKMFKKVKRGPQELSAMTIENFDAMSVPQLKAFLHVRFFTEGTTPRGQAHRTSINKRKVKDAMDGK